MLQGKSLLCCSCMVLAIAEIAISNDIEPSLTLVQLGARFFLQSSAAPRAIENKVNDGRRNVLLIIADDLDGGLKHLGDDNAYTPNLDALAADGVSFPMAYSNHPICAPSRASLLFGIYGGHSGMVWFSHWYENVVFNHSKTMMEHFKINGYQTYGAGKIFHPGSGSTGDELHELFYTDHGNLKCDYGPYAFDGTKQVPHPWVKAPFRDVSDFLDGSWGALENVPYGGGGGKGWVSQDLKTFDYKTGKTQDVQTAEWGIAKLREIAAQESSKRKPFMMILGFMKPHTPLHISRKWFDKVGTPNVPHLIYTDTAHSNDSFWMRHMTDPDMPEINAYDTLMQSYRNTDEGIRQMLQAYYAAKASVDDNIGQVLEALKATRQWNNTIVVVTSDHGYHIGQKGWIGKQTPWEEATRVPLIIRAPGVSKKGAQPNHVVSLIDLYPTLVDLCDLAGDTMRDGRGHPLDGFSLKPLIEGASQWHGPEGAISMIYQGHHIAEVLGESVTEIEAPERQHWALRTTEFRYILYNNGLEELYNHSVDKFELDNIAQVPAMQGRRQKLLHLLRNLTGLALEQGELHLAKLPWYIQRASKDK